MAANGRLPDSDLMAIPGGRLRTDAAKSWIRLRNKIGKEEGIWIAPTSSRTAYRPYADQEYFWNLYTSGRGALAAHPGTSNHGWGVAVDLPTPAMQVAMRKYGPEYGWGIRGDSAGLGSDAPSEAWHALYHPDRDRHKGESIKPRKPDSAYLTDGEAKSRRKLLRARREASHAGGFAKAPGTLTRAKEAKAEIRDARKRISQRAASDGGWKKNRRRERYRALGRALNGGK